jgi:hypothetical protein
VPPAGELIPNVFDLNEDDFVSHATEGDSEPEQGKNARIPLLYIDGLSAVQMRFLVIFKGGF